MEAVRCAIHEIPSELLLEIFLSLGFNPLWQLNRVCKKWHELLDSEQIWNGFYKQNFVCYSDFPEDTKLTWKQCFRERWPDRKECVYLRHHYPGKTLKRIFRCDDLELKQEILAGTAAYVPRLDAFQQILLPTLFDTIKEGRKNNFILQHDNRKNSGLVASVIAILNAIDTTNPNLQAIFLSSESSQCASLLQMCIVSRNIGRFSHIKQRLALPTETEPPQRVESQVLFTSPYELRKLLDNDLFQHLRFLYCSHQVSSDAHYIAAILRNYLPQSYMSICHFSGLNAEWTSLNNAPHLDTICDYPRTEFRCTDPPTGGVYGVSHYLIDSPTQEAKLTALVVLIRSLPLEDQTVILVADDTRAVEVWRALRRYGEDRKICYSTKRHGLSHPHPASTESTRPDAINILICTDTLHSTGAKDMRPSLLIVFDLDDRIQVNSQRLSEAIKAASLVRERRQQETTDFCRVVVVISFITSENQFKQVLQICKFYYFGCHEIQLDEMHRLVPYAMLCRASSPCESGADLLYEPWRHRQRGTWGSGFCTPSVNEM